MHAAIQYPQFFHKKSVKLTFYFAINWFDGKQDSKNWDPWPREYMIRNEILEFMEIQDLLENDRVIKIY